MPSCVWVRVPSLAQKSSLSGCFFSCGEGTGVFVSAQRKIPVDLHFCALEAQSKRSSPWAELRSLLCAAGRRICRLRCRASSKTAGISCVSRPFCFLNDVLSAKIPFPRPFRIPHPSDCPRGTGKGLPETPSVAYTYKLSKEMKSLGRMPKCLRKHLVKYDGVLKPTI